VGIGNIWYAVLVYCVTILVNTVTASLYRSRVDGVVGIVTITLVLGEPIVIVVYVRVVTDFGQYLQTVKGIFHPDATV
jgi:hypothetical protein